MTTVTRIALPLVAAVLMLSAPALAQQADPGPQDVSAPPPPPPPPPSDMVAPPAPPPPPAEWKSPSEAEKHKESLGGYGSVTYQLSFPFGNTHQYTGIVSWRGIGLDLQWMVTPNIAVGLLFAWNVFYQNTNEVINVKPGLDVSGGSQDRSLNVFPLMVDVRYMTGEKDDLRLFAGAGVGGDIIIRYLAIGLSSAQNTTFNFTVAPELGVLIPIKESGVALQLETRYNMAFAGGGLPFQNWLSLNLGVAWGSAL
jgi:hypothetical protein